MGGNAKKTTVDASQFEQVVAALMIVGKAELAEIMLSLIHISGARPHCAKSAGK